MPNLDAQLAAVRLAWSLDPARPQTLTDEQRQTLAGFMGWGQFAAAFAPEPEGAAAALADELEQILPPDALFEASLQVDTSFFTPAGVTARSSASSAPSGSPAAARSSPAAVPVRS